MSVQCLACGNDATLHGNFLPFETAYLQHEWQQNSVILQAGSLYVCKHCNIWFRNPYAKQSDLATFYNQIPNAVWSEPIDKPYWQTIRKTIKNYTEGKNILDVGCYMGDFLGFLDANYQKFGIEPSAYAQNIATQKGITILGNTIEDTHLVPESLDAIIMLDVLEHVQTPMQILENYYQGLKKDGLLVLATGATETTFFNFFAQYYWYANISMHCTFYSLSWFRWLTTKIPFQIVDYQYFSAGEKLSSYSFVKQLLIKSLYIIHHKNKETFWAKHLFKLPYLNLIPKMLNVPWLISAKDQILIFLQKTK